MLRYPSAGSSPLGDDECGDDPGYVPATVARDCGGDSPLHIETAKELLDVVEAGLDLDDEQCPAGWMKGKDVDPAPISVMVEADLILDDPTGATQQPDEPVLQLGMAGIGQRTFAIHAEVEKEVSPDSGRPSLDVRDCALAQRASLTAAQLCLGDAEFVREAALRPPFASPQGSQRSGNRSSFHPPTVARLPLPAAYWQVIRPLID